MRAAAPASGVYERGDELGLKPLKWDGVGRLSSGRSAIEHIVSFGKTEKACRRATNQRATHS